MQVSVLSFLQVWEDLWTSPYVTKEDIISVAAKQSNLIPRNQPGPRIPQAKGKFLASWAGRDKNKNKVCRLMLANSLCLIDPRFRSSLFYLSFISF